MKLGTETARHKHFTQFPFDLISYSLNLRFLKILQPRIYCRLWWLEQIPFSIQPFFYSIKCFRFKGFDFITML